MFAEKFHGDADGPDCVIDTATNGETLPDLVGWECWGCGSLFVRRDDAEECCAEEHARLKKEREAERERWYDSHPEADPCHIRPGSGCPGSRAKSPGF